MPGPIPIRPSPLVVAARSRPRRRSGVSPAPAAGQKGKIAGFEGGVGRREPGAFRRRRRARRSWLAAKLSFAGVKASLPRQLAALKRLWRRSPIPRSARKSARRFATRRLAGANHRPPRPDRARLWSATGKLNESPNQDSSARSADIPRGWTSSSRKPPRRLRPPPNSPTSQRGSTGSRRKRRFGGARRPDFRPRDEARQPGEEGPSRRRRRRSFPIADVSTRRRRKHPLPPQVSRAASACDAEAIRGCGANAAFRPE